MDRRWIAAVMGAALVAAAPALAHTDKYFDSVASPHGGQTRMAGPYHIELVTAPGEVTVYLADHANQGLATAGGEGKAVVKSPSGKTTIMLTPAGNNVLKGSGEFALGPESSVIVFVKLPDQDAWAAKFSPLKVDASTQDADHDDEDDDDDHDQGHHHEH